MMTSRLYDHSRDLHAVQQFLMAGRAATASTEYLHIGDFVWRLFLYANFSPQQNLRLWEDEQGQLLGFAFYYSADNSADLQLLPGTWDSPSAHEMLDWVIERSRQTSPPGDLTIGAVKTNPERANVLAQHGFRCTGDYYAHLLYDLSQGIEPGYVPAGFAVRPVEESELSQRVIVHQEAYSSLRVQPESYRQLRQTPGYKSELDLVAIAPDGKFAAFGLGWLDTLNRVGEFEPVGTSPAYRQQGLGQAILKEGLRRMQLGGAEAVLIYAKRANDAARKLYETVGFQEITRDYDYVRAR